MREGDEKMKEIKEGIYLYLLGVFLSFKQKFKVKVQTKYQINCTFINKKVDTWQETGGIARSHIST